VGERRKWRREIYGGAREGKKGGNERGRGGRSEAERGKKRGEGVK
jgi:hypothetical protein